MYNDFALIFISIFASIFLFMLLLHCSYPIVNLINGQYFLTFEPSHPFLHFYSMTIKNLFVVYYAFFLTIKNVELKHYFLM